jgi:hypothetical protein
MLPIKDWQHHAAVDLQAKGPGVVHVARPHLMLVTLAMMPRVCRMSNAEVQIYSTYHIEVAASCMLRQKHSTAACQASVHWQALPTSAFHSRSLRPPSCLADWKASVEHTAFK